MDFNLDSSDEPVINFSTDNATFEIPLTTAIETDSRNSTEHEEKYDIGCRRTPRCANGEVIPENAMFTADRETESDVIKHAVSLSFYAR